MPLHWGARASLGGGAGGRASVPRSRGTPPPPTPTQIPSASALGRREADAQRRSMAPLVRRCSVSPFRRAVALLASATARAPPMLTVYALPEVALRTVRGVCHALPVGRHHSVGG